MVAVIVAPILVTLIVQVAAFPLKLTTQIIENEVGQFTWGQCLLTIPPAGFFNTGNVCGVQWKT